MKKIVVMIVSVIGLSACSSTGPVQIGKDTYMINKMASTYAFSSSGAEKAKIIKEGSAHCASMGKQLQLVHTGEKPADFTNPTAEITYMCLSEGDPALRRTAPTRAPDRVIETRSN